jgi:hypothetical protein
MQLNADFSARVSVHTEREPWVPSPMIGVHRRMLDRIGGEVARATSIVRYAPGSRFSAHTHGGGEEFFVLEGVFQDEHGDYPAGTYVRNPPTSAHSPASASGCVIFVKLWQFAPEDRVHVRIETGKRPFQPAPDRPGVEVMPLYRDSLDHVRLERWEPGARVHLALPGGGELFVLEGGFGESGERFGRHSWLRLPAGSTLQAVADSDGCRLWVKTGHLREVRHMLLPQGLHPL